MITSDQISAAAASPSSISSDIRDWELEIKFHKKFLRLTDKNRNLFFALLSQENDVDSYATSPVYYALTGRKGLWIYQDGNSYVPLCWHPSVEGELLVFPPRGEDDPHILEKLLSEIPTPPKGIRLARVQKSAVDAPWLANVKNTLDRSVSLAPAEENILDWRHPVRVFSTENMKKREGGFYDRVVSRIKEMRRKKISVETLTAHHVADLTSFAYHWATLRAKSRSEFVELLSPYKGIFSLIENESFDLDGLVFYVDGQIQAVTIWELPSAQKGTANIWANLSGSARKGLSEFVLHKVSEVLDSQGISSISFAGSDAQRFDKYKRKYLPTHTIDLLSIETMVEDRDSILDTLIKFRATKLVA